MYILVSLLILSDLYGLFNFREHFSKTKQNARRYVSRHFNAFPWECLWRVRHSGKIEQNYFGSLVGGLNEGCQTCTLPLGFLYVLTVKR